MKGIRRWMIAQALTVIGVIALLGVVMVEAAELLGGEMAKQFQFLWQAAGVAVVCLCGALLAQKKGGRREYPDFYYAVVWSLIALGGVEAVYGLRQLYGFSLSNHSLYSMTGSFFNPGPYSGYLAMVFPLCLHEWLVLRKKSPLSWVQVAGKYSSLGVMLLIVCILPAGMSRSAWLAASVSGVWVYGIHAGWGFQLRQMWATRRRLLLITGLLGMVSLLVVGAALFHLKENSASGRLLMWKMSCRAIAEKPWTGHGMGNFAEAYGSAQEEYFAQGVYSSQEELVAGSPEYAFNEYLQLAVEGGIPMLAGALLFIGVCVCRGVRNSRLGICGAIISLMVFAFSSYPLQLPTFVVTLGVLAVACVVKQSRMWTTALIAIVIGVGWYGHRQDVYEECKDWGNARMLYHTGAYREAEKEYKALYPALKQRGAFLFEYGHCLHKMKQYEPSTRILREAATRTCDPMVLNIIGKNCQEKGEYDEAESWLIRSTHLLPGRIYPFYLLAKLYAEPDFYQPDKLKAAAEIVMTKEPKVQSTAIREMRNEIKKIIKEKEL